MAMERLEEIFPLEDHVIMNTASLCNGTLVAQVISDTL